MTYTGDVRPGGPPATRDLDGLSITKISVGPMDNNAYLLRCHRTGDQLMIDAAADAERLFGVIGAAGLSTIVTTHRHADHWQALSELLRATGAVSFAHEADAEHIPEVDRMLADGDTIACGRVALEVVHLVGHTPGSIALLYEDRAGVPHVFTGDSLFPGGVGKTAGRADFDSLFADVRSKLFDRLPDETWVYPGHGRDTTLGAERPALAEWFERGW
ncbi:MBL fold metallo-hydrolase [Phytomonospora sp. NPDC050363]|uniref:MBL fold metallo-hydrolase n=1 Tax=Phytomonospora sp. NPDC050363 TaxID=3155642 RepID=UPI0033C87002